MKHKERWHFSANKENEWRYIYYLPSGDLYAVSYFGIYEQFESLTAAVQFRDHLESDAGKQEIAERQKRREQDAARNARKEREQAANQERRMRDIAEGTVVYV